MRCSRSISHEPADEGKPQSAESSGVNEAEEAEGDQGNSHDLPDTGNQLTSSNTLRAFGRELTIATANGLSLGLLIGAGVGLIFHNPLLGAVMGAAIVINNLVNLPPGVTLDSGVASAGTFTLTTGRWSV